MTKIISDLLKSALLIGALSQTANADVIASNSDFIFNWTAICSDCDSTRGERGEEPVDVSGTIVLKDYTLGEEFIIDDFNLVSFSYNGPSIHLDAFSVENDNNAAASASIWESGIYDVSGSISDDLSSFELNFFHTIWEKNGETYYEKPEGEYGFFPSTMNVQFGSDSNWAFDIEGIPWDFGSDAVITPSSNGATDIPEPSTLAIFALGLMGLVSRKAKK